MNLHLPDESVQGNVELFMAYRVDPSSGVLFRVGKPHRSLKRAVSAVIRPGKTYGKGYVKEYNSGKIPFQNIIAGL